MFISDEGKGESVATLCTPPSPAALARRSDPARADYGILRESLSEAVSPTRIPSLPSEGVTVGLTSIRCGSARNTGSIVTAPVTVDASPVQIAAFALSGAA